MKTTLLSIMLCLLSFYYSAAQSDVFNNEVQNSLDYFYYESDYTILEHGGAITNTSTAIEAEKTIFFADTKYALFVMVDECTSCDVIISFTWSYDHDNQTVEVEPEVEYFGDILMGVYYFQEPETTYGALQVSVDSYSDYYTYYILMEK